MTDTTKVALENARPGYIFQACVPIEYTVEKIREEAKLKSGLDVHIKYRVGPTIVSGAVIDCPIEAIDDPYLEGPMSFGILNPGLYLYVGYFKEPEKKE